MSIPVSQVKYSDINTFYGSNTKLEVLVNEDAISNTYLNLVLIPPRSRKFRPTFSAYMQTYINQNVTPSTANQIKQALISNLTEWQPYGQIDISRTQVIPMSNNAGYFLDIVYQSLLTGIPGRLTLQLVVKQFANVSTTAGFGQ